MSQAEKSALYNELKDAGVEFDRHYREYSTEKLRAAVDKLRAAQGISEPDRSGGAEPEIRLPGVGDNSPRPGRQVPDTIAGIRLNTRHEDEPIRRDPDGTLWFQDEVRKPGGPKPRGRRIYKFESPSTKQVTIDVGNGATESFEVPGEGYARPMEAKVTLPSYQVGIKLDPRFPFAKIHTYNGRQGFDLFDIQKFYGGPEMVPTEIKRVYVESSLCYDIRLTIRAIQDEYRQRVLEKEITL